MGVHRVLVVMMAVAMMGLAAVPASPARADPCVGTRGAQALADRLCVDGEAIVHASALVAEVEDRAFAGVRFVTYSVLGQGGAVVVSRGDGWSTPLPAEDELLLRGPNVGGDAVEGPYRLLLLRTPMLPEWADALATRGVTVHAYVPENAFLVRSPSTGALADMPFVRGVTGLAAAAKVDPLLLSEQGAPLVNILTVPAGPGARAETLAALAALGGVVHQDAPEIERITARLDAGKLLDLAATPGILWIDHAGEAKEVDMEKIRPMVGAVWLAALPERFTGEGVVGQVMDSGLETTHPDLQRSLLAVDGTNSPDSHGTSVYGIVFGSGENDAQATGMAPDARGVFAWYDSGQTRYAHAQQLRDNWSGVFQTHSWGNAIPQDNKYDSYSNENDRVVRDLDVLMLQSMSNCGPLCARREAMAKNIVSVGGLYHLDTEQLHDDKWNQGSGRASTGPAHDGRIKPDLVGPYDLIYTTNVGNGYRSNFGGTSGATPVVAGSVALVHEMVAKGVFAGVSTPAPATIKAMLVASAEAYLPTQVVHTNPVKTVGNVAQRDIQGWGLPDLAALHGAAASALIIDETVELETGESATFAYTPAAEAKRVHVSLVWTDVPANPGVQKTLVNDLDLLVRDANGTVVFLGNVGLRDGVLSVPGGDPDRTNNIENVFLPAALGPLTITVRAAAVNLDAEPATVEVDQSFALVAISL